MDQRHVGSAIDLVPECVDVHLDDVADAVEVNVPDVLDNQGSRDGAVGIAHQEFEERVLLWPQVDATASARDNALDRVELQISGAQTNLSGLPSPEKRAEAGRHFRKRNGLTM